MAQAENKNLPEEEKSSSEETVLMNKRWGSVMIAPKSVPWMKESLAKQSRGPMRWYISKDDNPRNSVGADRHCRNIRYGGVLKYPRRKLLPPH